MEVDFPEPDPGLRHGLHARQHLLLPDRMSDRDHGRRPAGRGSPRRDQHAPAHHLRSGSDLGHHPPGGYLLRRHVRGIDHLDPDAHSRGSGVGDDLHRRVRHGPKGTGRARPGHRGHRLLRRRHPQRGGAHVSGPAAGQVRPRVRPAGVLLPASLRPRGPELHDRRLDREESGHDRARPAVRDDRHRPDVRVFPLFLRARGPGGRNRRRARRRGTLRDLRDPGDRGVPRTTARS